MLSRFTRPSQQKIELLAIVYCILPVTVSLFAVFQVPEDAPDSIFITLISILP